MPRRLTPAQAQAALRRAQAEQRRAISKYNSAVRQHNSKIKSAVNEYNPRGRAVQRPSTQRRTTPAAGDRTTTPPTRHLLHGDAAIGVARFHEAYRLVEDDFDEGVLPSDMAYLVDLGEGEVANSAQVANGPDDADTSEDNDDDPAVTDTLAALSTDLHRRWTGALFALNPGNPEAARHFCTSARETLLALIELRASDDVVLAADPHCAQRDGRPARRAKISYLLAQYGSTTAHLDDFVDSDIDDVITLVREVNNGTHGTAGRYDLPALTAIKRRVEGAVRFLTTIVQAA